MTAISDQAKTVKYFGSLLKMSLVPNPAAHRLLNRFQLGWNVTVFTLLNISSLFLSYFASDAYLSSNFSPISYYMILHCVITEFLQSVELMIENKMEALAFIPMPSIFHQG